MEVLWFIELGSEDFFPFNCQCNFFDFHGNIFYSFASVNKKIKTPTGRYGKRIYVYNINPITGERKEHFVDFYNDEKILLSNEWCYILDNGLILFTGKYLKILEESVIILNDYFQNNVATKRLSFEYTFENKIVKYNGVKTLFCLDKTNGKELWKIKLNGYIYTKIEYKNNDIIFGTAGGGSVLYTIELESGIIKRNDNNVMAANYSWYNDTIILPDKNGNIQIINPYANETIENYKIKCGKLSGYSPIKIYDDKIYTIVFKKNKAKLKGKIVCIKI